MKRVRAEPEIGPARGVGSEVIRIVRVRQNIARHLQCVRDDDIAGVGRAQSEVKILACRFGLDVSGAVEFDISRRRVGHIEVIGDGYVSSARKVYRVRESGLRRGDVEDIRTVVVEGQKRSGSIASDVEASGGSVGGGVIKVADIVRGAAGEMEIVLRVGRADADISG